MHWRFWQKPQQTSEADLDQWLQWEADARSRGFRHWIYAPPPSGIRIELARREWPMIEVCGADAVGPMMNIADLWWRAAPDPETGIIIDVWRALNARPPATL